MIVEKISKSLFYGYLLRPASGVTELGRIRYLQRYVGRAQPLGVYLVLNLAARH